jgi:SAM-dependent methyltransferase/uncharacterized protein YbaR (Trm112 family)
MRPDLVPHLRCPFCAADNHLELTGSSSPQDTQKTIENGTLRCAACGRATEITNGIWEAMGEHRPPRTLAQFINVVPPTPELYERVWRMRSLSLLSRRSFPTSEELGELRSWFSSLRRQSTVVDVGCSEGLYARAVAEMGHTVIAVDHSRRFLERVIQRAGSLPIICVRAVAQFMPIANARLDAVMIGGSLNEIGGEEAAAAEMARICAPGGLLFNMSLTRANTLPGRALQTVLRPGGVDFPTTSQTRDLFERAGFTVDRMRADGVVLRLEGTRRFA